MLPSKSQQRELTPEEKAKIAFMNQGAKGAISQLYDDTTQMQKDIEPLVEAAKPIYMSMFSQFRSSGGTRYENAIFFDTDDDNVFSKFTIRCSERYNVFSIVYE